MKSYSRTVRTTSMAPNRSGPIIPASAAKRTRRAFSTLGSMLFGQDGCGFDLDQQFHADQGLDLDHGGDGLDILEELAMRPANVLPARDVGHEQACAHHVFERGSGFLQGLFDLAPCQAGLFVGVS